MVGFAATARSLLVVSTLLPFGLGQTAFAADALKEQWRPFRNAFPMHIQTIAASAPDRTGALVVIITEPPPDTLPKATYQTALKTIFGEHLKQSTLAHTEIGLHGWVEDLVLTLVGYNGVGGGTALRDDLALLASKLWGTSYKAAPLALPIDPASLTAQGPPNIAIRQSELRDWLVGGSVRLSPDGTPFGQPKTLSQLIGDRQDGAFLSAPQRGLAVLVVSRQFTFEHYRAEFRKFALDSDVIFGAVAFGPDHLVFVGREREVPVTIMPPLRFETARILVSTKEKALSQSYERNDLFAGRLEEGQFAGRDWAPIYLSPVLVDTEFGSELNLTDQMLKSWSMAGQVKYYNFAWPTPPRLPFDGKPIIQQAQAQEPRIHETLFNWNTTGAFSRVEYNASTSAPKSDIFAIQYSGSLPIIYEDESQPEFDAVYTPFEVKGYEYYRHLRNPLLARVTSYQVLFQATRDRPLRIETPAPETVLSPPVLLGTWVDETYDRLKKPAAGLDDKKITELCRDTRHDQTPESAKCVETSKKLVLSVEIWVAGSERLHDRIVDDVLKPREAGGIDEAEQDKAFDLIKAIDAGKSVQIPDDVQPAIAAIAARFFLDGVRQIGLVEGDDRLAAFMLYTHNNPESTDSYITTPRVVVSSAGSDGVGGHDLSGATPLVLPDTTVPAGAARIVEDASGANAVHLNPTDIDKTGPVARQFAKRSASGMDKNALQQELRVVLAESQPQRPISAALVIERPDNPVRGYVVPKQAAAVERISWGWQSAPADGARLQRVLAIANQLDFNVVVTNLGDRFVVICVYCASGQEITALSHVAMRESVVDAIAHGPKGVESRIYFEGFSPNEVSAFKESLAFDGGGMEPPIGPPGQGAAPGDAPRWWKRGDDGGANRRTRGNGPDGGGRGPGGGNGNRGGGGSGNPYNTSLLILSAAKARSGAHEIEIKMTEGSRPTSVEEWVAVRREMSRSVDWSDARVEPVGEAQAMLSGQRMSLQLVIPPKNAEPGFQGRLEVQFARDARPDTKLEVTKAANDEIRNSMFIKQSIFLGVTRLVDRLRAIPHVADVRFFLKSGRNDAILSELRRMNADERG
jgi:hypothetical protein